MLACLQCSSYTRGPPILLLTSSLVSDIYQLLFLVTVLKILSNLSMASKYHTTFKKPSWTDLPCQTSLINLWYHSVFLYNISKMAGLIFTESSMVCHTILCCLIQDIPYHTIQSCTSMLYHTILTLSILSCTMPNHIPTRGPIPRWQSPRFHVNILIHHNLCCILHSVLLN